MKTPVEFTRSLKQNIITEEILENVLYSLNKRAKNCRDKKNEYYQKGKDSQYNRYSNYSSKCFDSVEKYKEKEKEYYNKKDFIISSLLQPQCIHFETILKKERVRYYDNFDYEEYYRYENSDRVIHKGSYYDREMQEDVNFIDVYEDNTIKNYYKFYETSNFSFHIPISETECSDELQVIEIKNFQTKGRDINGLISASFCDKLLELVKSENYVYKVQQKSSHN